MFTPMVAGVTIPGIALGLLMVAPYIDKNPSNKPDDRKFAICMFTIFLMLWAVLVIIGSFFRGPGLQLRLPVERRHLLRAVRESLVAIVVIIVAVILLVAVATVLLLANRPARRDRAR